MPYTEEGKFVMLNGPGLRPVISHVSLHSARPTETNDFELPRDIYRRQEIDLRDPMDGETKSAREMRFDIPPGGRVRYVGFWNQPAGGVMLAFKRTPKELVFNGRGVLVIDRAAFDLNLEEDD